MAKKKVKCKRCGKIIIGQIKIITYRKRVGKKSVSIVDMYDEDCFLIKNKERALDEHSNKERNCETGDCK